METSRELKPVELCRRVDPQELDFETTAALEDVDAIIGQPRAVEALRFGIGMEHEGFNIFALGPPGTGKRSLLAEALEKKAAERDVPGDWCYIYNFDEPDKPGALHLPAGRARELREDMAVLVEEVTNSLKNAFESEEFQNRQKALADEYNERRQTALEALGKQAEEHGLAMVRSPLGFGFAPERGGEVMPGEEFAKLPAEERAKIEDAIERFQKDLQETLQKFPRWERELREKARAAKREVIEFSVAYPIQEMRNKYASIQAVLDYLDAVEKDIIEHADDLLSKESDSLQSVITGEDRDAPRRARMHRYEVNVLIDRSGAKGAPVVVEDHPTYNNLLGRVEHVQKMGVLQADFTMIKPGALHRANGGYLLLDARKVLVQPYAWEGLKRALQFGHVRIQSLGEALGFVSTSSLDPEPIALSVKVALFGEPLLYYLLSNYDPEFRELFKVAADFDLVMDRDRESQNLYARLIATLARKHELRPLNREAVARTIEFSCRQAEDVDKLSTCTADLEDLLREADYWARESKRECVGGEDVERAIDARIRRVDRVRERLQERILQQTVLIDTEGAKVGQVNGLSVYQIGEFRFGLPARITARVRLGKGEVIDIEREVELSGPIHSKGVLILSSFLAARYSADEPLSLSASLVFEQSYGGVEGDSASCAELFALLSAISDASLNQSLAVTGSVNQRGEVQAIGGANEKIEGFFDVCQERGLTGNQGVLIPAANVRHLMLRKDVVEACAEGKFHIYPIAQIDEGMELLTGLTAGECGADGRYPSDSINARVAERLSSFVNTRRSFASPVSSGDES